MCVYVCASVCVRVCARPAIVRASDGGRFAREIDGLFSFKSQTIHTYKQIIKFLRAFVHLARKFQIRNQPIESSYLKNYERHGGCLKYPGRAAKRSLFSD